MIIQMRMSQISDSESDVNLSESEAGISQISKISRNRKSKKSKKGKKYVKAQILIQIYHSVLQIPTLMKRKRKRNTKNQALRQRLRIQ